MKEALINIATTIRNGGYPQKYGVPQDILGTLLSADEVYCEVPFCYLENSEDGKKLWDGIMDVIYCKDEQ